MSAHILRRMSLPPMSKPLFCSRALLADGWAQQVRVEIADGKFAAVERGAQAQPGDEAVDVLLPGIANVHSHGFQRGMAGLTEYRGPEADNFWSWRELMYRFVGRMSPEDLEAITAQAYVEMLESGFTRVGEFHYVHHDVSGKPYANPAEMAARVAAAAATTGIGLTLLPVFYAHGNFGGAPPTEGQRRFITDLDGYARLLEQSRAAVESLPDAIVGVAPHSLRAVTPEELERVTALCRRRADSYSCRGTGEGSRGLRGLVAGAPGAMAARQCGRRCTLVPGACHAHGCGRSDAAGPQWGGGRILSNHRGESRRRHCAGGALPGGRRHAGNRHGFKRAASG